MPCDVRWTIAIMGATSCLVFCEIYKYLAKGYIAKGDLADYSDEAEEKKRAQMREKIASTAAADDVTVDIMP